MTDSSPSFPRLTPAESRLHARRVRLGALVAVLGAAGMMLLLSAFSPNRPVEYESPLDHFYYGSFGADISGGLPLKVLRVLPAAFPEHLPAHADEQDYRAFGFIKQPDHAMPIGFSVRRQFIDYAGLNCAVCHTGTVRKHPGAARTVIPGMPANTVDLLGYFEFLFAVANDKRFTSRRILAAMREKGIADPLDPLIYRIVVPLMKDGLQEQQQRLRPFLQEDYPDWGPGRVNTFDVFKYDQFRDYYEAHDEPITEKYGIVDNPSVWNQAKRDSLWLHWDGNNDSAVERNFSAAIAAGARPEDMDVESLLRTQGWLDTLSAPQYPYAVDQTLVQRGKDIYQSRCATCHSYDGTRVGTVVPIENIGTDRHRMDSYTPFFLNAQKDYTAGFSWQFSHFRNTQGYAARPLDGIWARAPYLHNGSVPTMRALLQPEDQRPDVFTRGSDVYNQDDVGFRHQELSGSRASGYVHPDGSPYEGPHFVYDTRLPGNDNRGHTGPRYGTTLSPDKKDALIEYLKTL